NGSFEEEIIPGGFSWRLEPPASRTLHIDTQEFRAGMASVSLAFDGPTFSDYGFSQLIPVKSKQLYEVFVIAKSQEIQSSDGPRIMVEDASNHTLLTKGPEWQGTHGWNEDRFLFPTFPDTQLALLYVRRATGAGLIRGKLWIDNLSMYER